MNRKMSTAALLLLAGSAACGGASSGDDGGNVGGSASRTLTVHVLADQPGIGCFQTPISAADRLVVEDGSGSVLGSAQVKKTPHTGSCDWTSHVTVTSASVYRLGTDQHRLITINSTDIRPDGLVELRVDATGAVELS